MDIFSVHDDSDLYILVFHLLKTVCILRRQLESGVNECIALFILKALAYIGKNVCIEIILMISVSGVTRERDALLPADISWQPAWRAPSRLLPDPRPDGHAREPRQRDCHDHVGRRSPARACRAAGAPWLHAVAVGRHVWRRPSRLLGPSRGRRPFILELVALVFDKLKCS